MMLGQAFLPALRNELQIWFEVIRNLKIHLTLNQEFLTQKIYLFSIINYLSNLII